MAFGENYHSKYFNLATQTMDKEYSTKAQAERLATEARRAILKARNESTREVSNRWRDRFIEIKAENDVAQKAIQEAYNSAYMEIGAMLADMYEGLEK